MPRTLPQAIGFLLGIWIAIFLSPLTLSATQATPPPEAELIDAPFASLEARLHEGVNHLRSQHHLIPLQRRAELDRVARAHSADMALREYLSHESPEGANAVHRLYRAGLDGFTLAAENIGRTSLPNPTTEIVVSWVRSQTHRQNLIAPPFNATGIGVARARDGSYIFTQIYLSYPGI